MHDENNQDMHPSGEKNKGRREMSRRQFLSYTLGGTGAFMAFGPVMPMIRFAVDPILQPKAVADWVKVVEVEKITETPTSFTFQMHQVDGWYESKPEFSAWISKDKDGKIFALSPVCKHLGCMVSWNGDPKFQDQYFCPCHAARYTKDGKQLVVAPLPLDEYSVKVDNGFVYVGQIKPNTRVK
jgi:menaquinol-cytochrome c reductase iron-sulfur subunit